MGTGTRDLPARSTPETFRAHRAVKALRAGTSRAPPIIPSFPSLGTAHGCALDFTVGFARLQIFPLVKLGFSFADSQGDFHFPILPIQGEWQQRMTFDG